MASGFPGGLLPMPKCKCGHEQSAHFADGFDEDGYDCVVMGRCTQRGCRCASYHGDYSAQGGPGDY